MIPIAEKDKATFILRLWIGIDHLEGRKATPLQEGDGFHRCSRLVGSVHLVFGHSIYLREKTVRRLNRRRREKRLMFRA